LSEEPKPEMSYGTISTGVVASPRVGMNVTRAVVAASGLVGVALLALLAVTMSSQSRCLLAYESLLFVVLYFRPC
jgi:uncharacterized protein (UPF0212 family)